MALTIRPNGISGKLAIYADDGTKIGSGKAKASKTEPGYITLTLKLDHIPMGVSFRVLRVPIDWTIALAQEA